MRALLARLRENLDATKSEADDLVLSILFTFSGGCIVLAAALWICSLLDPLSRLSGWVRAL